LNEIVSQRFSANTRLSIIAVGRESIQKRIDAVSALKGSPRVITMCDGAKAVLERKTLVQAVRQALKANATAEPF
jgi:hypothetical protein